MTRMDFKTKARRLRGDLHDRGVEIAHGQALDLVARQNGYRDWNTLSARHPDETSPATPPGVGERVGGRYLGQPFDGTVQALERLPGRDRYRITVSFDAPVDVVRFDSFSSFRRRVTTLIDGSGEGLRHTSDGAPHIRIRRIGEPLAQHVGPAA
jgi:hypothetical protein